MDREMPYRAILEIVANCENSQEPSTKSPRLGVFFQNAFRFSQSFLPLRLKLKALSFDPEKKDTMICSRAFRALMRRDAVYRKRNLIGSVSCFVITLTHIQRNHRM